MNSGKANLLFCFLISTIAIIFGCAKVASPPGGPEDKTPPDIISTYPLNNAVNIQKDNKITIAFSEGVDKIIDWIEKNKDFCNV